MTALVTFGQTRLQQVTPDSTLDPLSGVRVLCKLEACSASMCPAGWYRTNVDPVCVLPLTRALFFTYLFVRERRREGEREGEQHQCARETLIVASRTCPDWGPNPQPRHAPIPEIKLATFRFAGQSHAGQGRRALFFLPIYLLSTTCFTHSGRDRVSSSPWAFRGALQWGGRPRAGKQQN